MNPEFLFGLPQWMGRFAGYGLEVALLAAGFFVLGALGFWLQIEPRGENLIWPPAALALVAYWLRGPWAIPGITIGWLVLALVYRIPWFESGSLAIAQIFEAAFACYWLRSQQFNPRFDRLGDLLDLMFFAGLFAGLAAASLRALGFMAGETGEAPLLLAHRALHWWLADALAILTLAPVMMVWSVDRNFGLGWRRILELAVLLAVFAATAWLNLDVPTAGTVPNPILLYLLIPLSVWAGARFGAHGASLLTLLSGASLLWAARKGVGPFLDYPPYLRALLEAGFIATLGFTAHGTSALIAERKQSANLLKDLEHGFGQLLQASSDGFLILDEAGTAQYANDRFSELLGVPRQRIMGRPIDEFMPVNEFTNNDSAFGSSATVLFQRVGLDAISRYLRLVRGGLEDSAAGMGRGGFFVLTEVSATERSPAETLDSQEAEEVPAPFALPPEIDTPHIADVAGDGAEDLGGTEEVDGAVMNDAQDPEPILSEDSQASLPLDPDIEGSKPSSEKT